MVVHAGGGFAEVIVNEEYIEIVLEDTGPGIHDIEQAMQAGFSTASDKVRSLGFGAGMGLPNMKKNTLTMIDENEEDEKIIAVCNFTKVERPVYKIGVPEKGTYEIVFNSDSVKFGGIGEKIKKTYKSLNEPYGEYSQSIDLKLPPLSTIYLKLKQPKTKTEDRKECKNNGKKN